MSRVKFSLALACVASLFSAEAYADVLWDDFNEVAQKFAYTAAEILPKKCFSTNPDVPDIGPISFAATGANEVTYEARLIMSRSCRSKLIKGLNRRVAEKKPIISYATARVVEYYNTSGDGPTIMVRLIADDRMLSGAAHPRAND